MPWREGSPRAMRTGRRQAGLVRPSRPRSRAVDIRLLYLPRTYIWRTKTAARLAEGRLSGRHILKRRSRVRRPDVRDSAIPARALPATARRLRPRAGSELSRHSLGLSSRLAGFDKCRGRAFRLYLDILLACSVHRRKG